MLRCSRATLYKLLPLLPDGGVVRRPARDSGRAGPKARILIHKWALGGAVEELRRSPSRPRDVRETYSKYGVG